MPVDFFRPGHLPDLHLMKAKSIKQNQAQQNLQTTPTNGWGHHLFKTLRKWALVSALVVSSLQPMFPQTASSDFARFAAGSNFVATQKVTVSKTSQDLKSKQQLAGRLIERLPGERGAHLSGAALARLKQARQEAASAGKMASLVSMHPAPPWVPAPRVDWADEVMGATKKVEFYHYGATSEFPWGRFEMGVDQPWVDLTQTPRNLSYSWNQVGEFPAREDDGRAGVKRSGCQLETVHRQPDNIYWKAVYADGTNPDGNPQVKVQDLTHEFVTIYNPQAYHVSDQVAGVQGLQTVAKFNTGGPMAGERDGQAAVESVFVGSRRCTDGGWEYGLASDPVNGVFFAYVSDYVNCAAGYCNSSSNPAPELVNGVSPTGIDAKVGAVIISDIGEATKFTAGKYLYQMYFVDNNHMALRILDPVTEQPIQARMSVLEANGNLKVLSEGDAVAILDCEMMNANGFARGDSGYAVSVAQNVSTKPKPAELNDMKFEVESLKLGR